MSSVDDRIVNMQFNNKQFVSGATESQRVLEGLDKSLANAGRSGGLNEMASAVDGVTTRFGALKIAGVTAIATIASQATMAGVNLLKSMTLGPLMQGFSEYELNLKSIQTVVANTGESINTVNKYMQDLNHYSDKTIYNFSQMAQNIGRFTAAGVELPQATLAIKGMANTAALAGADVNQLNSAMYQVSQALSAGTIKLMDWNSLVNANMGGQNIQESLKATALSMGAAGDAMQAAIGEAGNFRDSLQAGWLTADVFTKTMKVMSGQTIKTKDDLKAINMTQEEFEKAGHVMGDTVAYTVDQLKKMGYSEKAAKQLSELSQSAIDSATQIRTASQLFDVIKESIGSGFSSVFQNLFGDLKEASALWTGVGNTITGAIGGVFKSINQMLKAWDKAGGYDAMWQGFGNIFKAIGNILHPFVAAFQELFPATGDAGEGLAKLSKGFESTTGAIEVFTRGFDVLTPVLVGIAKTIGFVLSQLGKLFGLATGLAKQGFEIADGLLGGILSGLNVDTIKNAIVQLGNDIVTWIKDTLGIHSPADSMIPVGEGIVLGIAQGIVDTVQNIYGALGTIVNGLKPIVADLISNIVDAVKEGVPKIISTLGDLASKAIPAIGDAIGSASAAVGDKLSATSDAVSSRWEKVQEIFSKIGNVVSSVMAGVGRAFAYVTGWMQTLFGGKDALDWATLINAAFTGGILLQIHNMAGLFEDFFQTFKGMGDTVKGTFESMTGALDQMQSTLKAQALQAIAIAVGVLVASVVALTFLDPKEIAVSIGAIATLMGTLVGTMLALGKLKESEISMPALAGSILLISVAMTQLAAAVLILGKQDMATLGKGLGAVAIGLGVFVLALGALSGLPPGSVEGMAGSILVMALAMNVLAAAVLAFGNMSWETLGKGLGAVAVGLGIFVLTLGALSGLPPGSIEGVAASIMVMALAMNVLALAVLAFGNMDWKTLGVGFASIAVGLGLFVGALMLLGPMAPAVATVAGSMLTMAAAMVVLAVAVGMFGNMDTGTLAKGFIAIAAGLALLVIAAAAAQAVAPGLLVLGTTLLMMGAAMALAGVGMLAFATGLAILTAVGVGAVAVITIAIQAFLALLPSIAIQVAAAFVSFLETIAAASPRIAAAFNKIFDSMLSVVRNAIPKLVNLVVLFLGKLLDGITRLIPKFGRLISQLIETGLNIITKAVPQYVDAGVTIVMKVLEGFAQKLPRIIDAAGDLVVNFIEGIGKQATKIANAAGQTILDFLEGLRGAIEQYSGQIRTEGLKIAYALADGLSGGLLSTGVQMVRDAAEAIAESLPGWMRKVLGISSPSKVTHQIGVYVAEGLARGIAAGSRNAVQAVLNMANQIIAEGNKAVLAAQRAATQAQSKAYQAQARADLLAARAKTKAKYARQHEENKAAQRAAKEAQKIADKAQSQADAQQKKADAAQNKVSRVQQFQEADLHGKGDIKTDQALSLADKANKMLAKANAEAAEARKLMKTNREAGEKLLRQSERTARDADKLADQAKAARAKALEYYKREVNERIKQIEKQRAAEEKAKQEQEAFDAADAQGKSDILTKRAEANEKKAEAQKKLSEKLMAMAKKFAKTDADRAMKLLDRAEAAAQKSEDAANQAEQERKDAQQALTGGSTGGSSTNVNPSQSVLEDAARAVDRYTASLQLATDLASTDSGSVQFVQNNYSPEALSTIDIYRQSKNLISSAEVKMVAPK